MTNYEDSNSVVGTSGRITDRGADATVATIARHIIPLVMIGYCIAFVDRSNIAMAALTMSRDLSFTATIFGWGSGVFFLGYVLFERPSNMALARFGARTWISRIMAVWAALSIATAWVWNPYSFYIARFLLGVAEAGFVPGVIFYLSYWFPARYRARMFGLFIAANPISGVIGNPLAGVILRLDGLLALHGWQWIFILEGVPALLLAGIFYVRLPDHPGQVSWLSHREREWLKTTLAAERSRITPIRIDRLRSLLLNGNVWLLSLAYLGIASGSYGVVFWLPQIMNGFGYTSMTVGMLAAIPWVFATAGMIYWTLRSDRTQERGWHLAAACVLGFGGLGVAAYSISPIVSLIGLTAAAVGTLSATATFWAFPTTLLAGSGMPAGLAFINSIGSLGGFVGPYLMGLLKDLTGDYRVGLLILASGQVIAAIIALLFRSRLQLVSTAAERNAT
jgi:MFS transporter, ACS family, tartrate transporter